MDLVEYPDTTAIAHRILTTELAARGHADVVVASRMPAALPDRFIRCFTLPGHEYCRRTMACQVVVMVYDQPGHDVRAFATARTAAAILRSAPDAPGDWNRWISTPAEQHGPFPSQDPDLPDRPCYQANVVWTVQSQITT